MTDHRRHYSTEERSAAVGLAISVGVKEAGRRLAIPYRTVSHWLARPDAQAAIARSRDDVAAKLWEAVTVGTEAVLAGLRDPKARLGDKANALRIVSEQYALLTGGPTSRSETLNLNADVTAAEIQQRWNDEQDALAFVRQLEAMDDEQLAEYLASAPLAVARALIPQPKEAIAPKEAIGQEEP